MTHHLLKCFEESLNRMNWLKSGEIHRNAVKQFILEEMIKSPLWGRLNLRFQGKMVRRKLELHKHEGKPMG